ncbi:hypothetical protein HK098_005262 [Nowakowskiella sp. JEL0407]|nr:hypothetical protein HK098_005262 [Nowakowskiella sp. JEL0407]
MSGKDSCTSTQTFRNYHYGSQVTGSLHNSLSRSSLTSIPTHGSVYIQFPPSHSDAWSHRSFESSSILSSNGSTSFDVDFYYHDRDQQPTEESHIEYRDASESQKSRQSMNPEKTSELPSPPTTESYTATITAISTRIKILRELLHTEKKYLSHLSELSTLYIAPISLNRSISQSTVTTLFNNSTILIEYQKKMTEELESCLIGILSSEGLQAKWIFEKFGIVDTGGTDDQQDIAECFNTVSRTLESLMIAVDEPVDKYTSLKEVQDLCDYDQLGQIFSKLEFYEIYVQYIYGLEPALALVEYLTGNSWKDKWYLRYGFGHGDERSDWQLRSCLEKAKFQDGHSQIGLGAYLLLPMQRLTRYRMLLHKLTQHTSEESPAFEPLVSSVSVMHQIILFSNQAKSYAAHLARQTGWINALTPKTHSCVPDLSTKTALREGYLRLVKIEHLDKDKRLNLVENVDKNVILVAFDEDLVVVDIEGEKQCKEKLIGAKMVGENDDDFCCSVCGSDSVGDTAMDLSTTTTAATVPMTPLSTISSFAFPNNCAVCGRPPKLSALWQIGSTAHKIAESANVQSKVLSLKDQLQYFKVQPMLPRTITNEHAKIKCLDMWRYKSHLKPARIVELDVRNIKKPTSKRSSIRLKKRVSLMNIFYGVSPDIKTESNRSSGIEMWDYGGGSVDLVLRIALSDYKVAYLAANRDDEERNVWRERNILENWYEGRPCQRCIKRKIGHLCRDEQKPSPSDLKTPLSNLITTTPPAPSPLAATALTATTQPQSLFPFTYPSAFPPLFANELSGNEFSALTDFLADYQTDPLVGVNPATASEIQAATTQLQSTTAPMETNVDDSLSTTEKFILTAADPSDSTDSSYSTRLTQIIHAKFEAGLIKPYNYSRSYTRLQNWMSLHLHPSSTIRVKNVLETFRPKFRKIAGSLTDIDLVLVEENFERMLLEYDRLFSAMGVPACLWRRTGEIWKSNKEFADLCDVDVSVFRDGKLCIYELMSEESAVNYWEKYGNIAFDCGQKAVLTSCVITTQKNGEGAKKVDCCFSFTIRRDKYGIPLIIAGNFLPVNPQNMIHHYTANTTQSLSVSPNSSTSSLMNSTNLLDAKGLGPMVQPE